MFFGAETARKERLKKLGKKPVQTCGEPGSNAGGGRSTELRARSPRCGTCRACAVAESWWAAHERALATPLTLTFVGRGRDGLCGRLSPVNLVRPLVDCGSSSAYRRVELQIESANPSGFAPFLWKMLVKSLVRVS
ncbi:hypothetical protein BAE44_0006471 [Dichanthelium oligosanthes]|uniref:Uncharacterized protein n=1 Tax=Dichanthelium oligosanthes TaxID=888268 RepID=A0A1E5W5E6_9POAL|nr:hypothetical protein BAE44_0006471 [Dichanthelium oligosanthes]